MKGRKGKEVVLKFSCLVQSLRFTGAGAGVGDGEKNTRSRSKTDRLPQQIKKNLTTSYLLY